MMLKKTTLWLLSVMMLLTMLVAGCGGGEENGHQQAHRDRIGCDLLRLGVGRHHRDVLFARFEFAVRVVGQRLRGFGLFHCVCRFSLKFRDNLQK